MQSVRIGRFFLYVLLLSVLVGRAQAATVPPVYQNVGPIFGVELIIEPFTVDVAGNYQMTLIDFGVPDPFDSLFFAVTTNSTLEGVIVGSGTSTFLATPEVTYFARIFGDARGGVNLGLFGAQVAVVPLPASAILLGSAMFALLVIGRRRKSQLAT